MKSLFYKHWMVILLFCFFSNMTISKDHNLLSSSTKYECQLITRSDAINRAKNRMDGKVVGVKLSEKGDRSVYRVRILVNKKRIRTVSIPACR